jgi:glycosyltransferase involved in cell wall biosynthesis
MQGVPVISTDYGPMPELNFRPEMVVSVDGYREGEDYGLPSVAGIVVRLQTLYDEWKQDLNSGANLSLVNQYAPEFVFPKNLDGLLKYMFNHYYPPLIKVHPKKVNHIGLISTYGVNCGIATYTQMLAESLRDLGHKVTIFAECTESQPIATRGSINNIDIEYCWNRKYLSGGALAYAIESVNPEILHVQHEATMLRSFADLYSTLRGMDKHIVTTLHTPDFNNEAVKEAILLSDGVFLHNERLAVELAGTVPAPVNYIPHGVLHIPPSPSARKEIGLPEGIPLIFHYGFPSKAKGTLTLLKAVEKVKETTQYFEVAIFAGENASGANDYTRQCEALASQIDGVFYSKEYISEAKLNQFLNASNIIAFPYSGQGVNSTSGAVMRTLSAGKPIIATDEGRLRDLIGGIHGWKCAANDVDSLASAIKEAIRVYSTEKPQYTRMAENVKSLASERDWPIIAGKHSISYTKICAAWAFHHHSVLTPIPNGNAPLLSLQDKPTSSDQEE